MSRRLASGLTFGVAAALAGGALALEAGAPSPLLIPPLAGFATVSESGPRWSSLTPAQRDILGPLQDDWSGIDAGRKQKWLELAARYPTLSRTEQSRIRDRMAEWARLSPSQRGEARANFQQANRTPAADRQAQWEAYQALPAEEKSRLAGRANEVNRSATSAGTRREPGAASPSAPANRERTRDTASSTKSNLVPNPVFTTAPRPVGPTVVRSGPGATTTLVNRQPAPPVHQLPGLPKVPATPTLVDQTTLLPQRGPQAAAVLGPSAPQPSSDAPGE